jgi:endonuclease-8
MPEGPSLVILKEETQRFVGKKITKVAGNAKIDLQRMKGEKITDIKSWGKHLLICFNDFFLRIHLMMFGSYRIDEKKDSPPRLHLKFSKGQLNFYSCSVRMIEGRVEDIYDWELDTMSPLWNSARALKSVSKQKKELVCDVLLDQEIFAGVGNIIKNEALFICRTHPLNTIEKIPAAKLKELVRINREYCFDFYKWKKEFTLRKHWLIYRKQLCSNCGGKIKISYPGKRERRNFTCDNCQIIYKRNVRKKA